VIRGLFLAALLAGTQISCTADARPDAALPIADASDLATAKRLLAASSIWKDKGPLQLRTDRGLLTLESFRFEPAESDGLARTGLRCGIVISSGTERVAVTTIGDGWTETLSCGGLVEVAAFLRCSGQPRIVMIYKASTPNGLGRVAVVLKRTSGQAWLVDEHKMEQLSLASQPPTMPILMRGLSCG
jgi:hypothetical protein